MNTNQVLIASTALSSLLFVAISIFAGVLYSKYDKLESFNSLISAMKDQPKTSVEKPQELKFAPASVEVKPSGGISLAVESLNLAPKEFKDLQITTANVSFNLHTMGVKPTSMNFPAPLPAAPQSPPLQLSKISFHRMYSFLNASSTTTDLAKILLNFEESKNVTTFIPLHNRISGFSSKATAHDFVDYAAALKEESPGEAPPLIKALYYSSLSYLHKVRAKSFIYEILETSSIEDITTKLDNYRENNDFTSIRDLVDECVENEITNVMPNFFNELYLSYFYGSKMEDQLKYLGNNSENSRNLYESIYKPLKLHYAGKMVSDELYDNICENEEIFCINFDSLEENLKEDFIKMAIAYYFSLNFSEPGFTIEFLITACKNDLPECENMWEFIKNLLDKSNQFKFDAKRKPDGSLEDLELVYNVPDSIKNSLYWISFEKRIKLMKKKFVQPLPSTPEDWNYFLQKDLDFEFFMYLSRNRNVDKFKAVADKLLEYDFNESKDDLLSFI
jgi:hypothetical protein